jgi:hypothetical protein
VITTGGIRWCTGTVTPQSMPIPAELHILMREGSEAINRARALRAVRSGDAARRSLVTLVRDRHRARNQGDGNDSCAVAAAICETSLCWRCITGKTGLSAMRLNDVLMSVRRSLVVTVSLASCDLCQRATLLFRLP